MTKTCGSKYFFSKFVTLISIQMRHICQRIFLKYYTQNVFRSQSSEPHVLIISITIVIRPDKCLRCGRSRKQLRSMTFAIMSCPITVTILLCTFLLLAYYVRVHTYIVLGIGLNHCFWTVLFK